MCHTRGTGLIVSVQCISATGQSYTSSIGGIRTCTIFFSRQALSPSEPLNSHLLQALVGSEPMSLCAADRHSKPSAPLDNDGLQALEGLEPCHCVHQIGALTIWATSVRSNMKAFELQGFLFEKFVKSDRCSNHLNYSSATTSVISVDKSFGTLWVCRSKKLSNIFIHMCYEHKAVYIWNIKNWASFTLDFEANV